MGLNTTESIRLTNFRFGGTAPIACPICCDDFDGDEMTMGFLHRGNHASETLRIRGLAHVPASLYPEGEAPDDDIPRGMGDDLTGSPHEPVYLTCPHPDCRRRYGPFTAHGLWHRLRQGLPLVVR